MDNETLAKAAGLARAWTDHRADVEEAIAAAQRMKASFTRPTGPEAEPMPAYGAPARPKPRTTEDYLREREQQQKPDA